MLQAQMLTSPPSEECQTLCTQDLELYGLPVLKSPQVAEYRTFVHCNFWMLRDWW